MLGQTERSACDAPRSPLSVLLASGLDVITASQLSDLTSWARAVIDQHDLSGLQGSHRGSSLQHLGDCQAAGQAGRRENRETQSKLSAQQHHVVSSIARGRHSSTARGLCSRARELSCHHPLLLHLGEIAWRLLTYRPVNQRVMIVESFPNLQAGARLRELRSPELHAASLEGPEDAQDRSGSPVPTASSVEQARGTDKTGCMTSVRGRGKSVG